MGFLTVLTGIIALLSTINIVFLRFLNREWWQLKPARFAAFIVPVATLAGLAIMIIGFRTAGMNMIAVGALTGSAGLILTLSMLIALPLASLSRFALSRLLRTAGSDHPQGSASKTLSRRAFVSKTAAAFPVVTGGLGVGGLAASFSDVMVDLLEIEFDRLPSQLDGFRILHLSDLHLGRYFQLSDLENTLQAAEQLRPDLVLVTGDICDITGLLPDTLRMIASLHPRNGCFASIGNHEYYHGIANSIEAHGRSEVPLLLEKGVTLTVGGADLYIGGSDDPRSLFDNTDEFLRATVDRSLTGAPQSAFKIIMSHRPRGFVSAAAFGVDLTLAGHTHGGQIGLAGRSVFETYDPPNFYWGLYKEGRARLYTSAGVGHWFPFRLGCPAEAPVIVLRSARG
jgi:hypothetical protein